MENFKSENKNDIELVVARYNESIDWINKKPFTKFKITCYNKGINLPKCLGTCNIINIPNIGRCDHTYLYHIIENYDNLAPVTLFLPGSCLDKHKKVQTLLVLENVILTRNTVFVGYYYDNIADELFDFKMDEYVCQNKQNAELNPENILALSDPRPFGKWYKNNFGDIITHNVSFYGIFAVSRKHILQHSKEYYINLLSYLDTSSNPEAGHYFERSWNAIFYPIEESCFYYE